MRFEQEETEQIIWARLVLLGVPPSEIEGLDEEDVQILLQVAAGQAAAQHGKIYGVEDV